MTRRPGRRRPHRLPAPTASRPRSPGRLMVTSSSDVPMKGLVPLLEAVAKLRTEREVELVVIGRPRPGGRVDRAIERLGLGRRGALRQRDQRRRAGRGSTPRPRWRWCPPSTRASRCRPSRPWPAACRSSPPPAARCPRWSGATARPACWCHPTTPGRWPPAIAPAARRRRRCAPAWARRARAGARPVHLGGHRPGDGRAATRRCWRAGRRPARRPRERPVLTVDYDRLGVRRRRPAARPGVRVRPPRLRGGPPGRRVVALDAGADEVDPGPRHVRRHGRRRRGRPIDEAGGGAGRRAAPAVRRRRRFDRVIASEVLEHIPDDVAAIAELARVLRPGGTMAVTVPAVRARGRELGALRRVPRRARRPHPHLPALDAPPSGCAAPGCGPSAATTPTGCTRPTGGCAAWSGPTRRPPGWCAAYHRLLVWDIVERPRGRPGRPSGAQPADRQEPGPLPREAGMTRDRSPSARPADQPGTVEAPRARPPGRRSAARGRRGARRAEVLATAASIAEVQRPDGMIPWFAGGHCDPWNHVEAAMALSVCGLRTTRPSRPTGGWPTASCPTGAGSTTTWPSGVKDPRLDTNVCAYLATGVWHHHLVTGDTSMLDALWPVVERALDFVLRWQRADGSVLWSLDPDGQPEALRPADRVVVDLPRLRCGVAVRRAPRATSGPTGSWPPAGSATPSPTTPGPSQPKDEFAMDWYYPVLSGASTGEPAAAPHRTSGGTPSSWTASGCAACRPGPG